MKIVRRGKNRPFFSANRIQVVFRQNVKRDFDLANLLETYLRADWSGIFEVIMCSGEHVNDPHSSATLFIGLNQENSGEEKGGYIFENSAPIVACIYYQDDKNIKVDLYRKMESGRYFLEETQQYGMISDAICQFLKTIHHYLVVIRR